MQSIATTVASWTCTLETGVTNASMMEGGLPARSGRKFPAYFTTFFLKEKLPIGEMQPSETTSHRTFIQRPGRMVTRTLHSGMWLAEHEATFSPTSTQPLLVASGVHVAALPLDCGQWVRRQDELCASDSAQTDHCATDASLCSSWSVLQARMEDRLPTHDVRLEGGSPC